MEEVGGILSAHREDVVKGPGSKVVIARTQVWASFVNSLKRSQHRLSLKSHGDTLGPLKVTFVGDAMGEEEAIDQGGPRRELFRLLLPDMIRNSGMLTGM